MASTHLCRSRFSRHSRADNARFARYAYLPVVVGGSPELSTQACTPIADATEVYVRSASIRKASIKAGIGELGVEVDALVVEITGSIFLGYGYRQGMLRRFVDWQRFTTIRSTAFL